MNEQMYKNFLKTCFKVMNFVRNPQVTTVLVFAFVLSVILFKLVNEPYIFDPKFGAQSVYGFSASDAKEPFTVFYIAKGADFTGINGDFQVLNQTLQIKSGNNTSAEWSFDFRKFLNILKRCGGEIEEATVLFTKPNPFSSAKNASVLIYVNDYLVANKSLQTTSEDKYTWDVRTQWDIPGTNYGYPYDFAIFSIPKESVFSDTNDNLPARVRVVTSEGVHWDIDYVIVKLYSDPYALKSPWWHQNFLSILTCYISVFLIALTAVVFKFEKKRRSWRLSTIDAAKRWVSSNSFILFYIGAGLLLRLILTIIFPLGSGDQYTYRFISIASYYYGVDTRSFYSIYGTVWHGLLLASYPVYLSLSQFASSISLEYAVLKLPIIASDILIAFMLYRIGSKLADQKIAKILLVFWLFSPYVIWLSPIWGTHHIVPTMLTVLAVERIIYRHYKSSAIALSAAIFSGFNTIFLLPVFLILIYKSLGKPRLVEFLNFFLLGCSIFALPWTFSIAIFSNTYTGAGRVGVPTLSYSYFLVPAWLTGFWSVITLLFGLILLCVYITRKNQFNISQINDYILIVFLIFYLTNTLVFPTYAIWSLPFLLFTYVSTRKFPLSYVVFFISFPLLWILYWSPPLLPNFLQAPGAEIFRDTFGLNFSFVCLLILTKLSFARNKPQTNVPWTRNQMLKSKLIPTKVITSITLIFIVFAPWIKQPLWLTFWDSALKPSLFILSTGLILFTIIWNWRRSIHEKEKTGSVKKIWKGQYVAVVAIIVIWVYNTLVLMSSQVFPLVFNLSPVLLQSQDDLYFSLILFLWLPLIVCDTLKNRQSLSFVTWVTLLQIDYIITRHYNTYIVTNHILGTYAVKDMPTLVVDLFAVILMLSFLLLTTFYESKRMTLNVKEA